MSDPRDDMVLRPRLVDESRGTASVHGREERRSGKALREDGLLERGLRSMRRRAARGALGMVNEATGGLWGEGAGALRFMRRGLGGLAGAAAVGGALALIYRRATTDQSFESMGEMMNNWVLGDIDDAARAGQQARDRITADPHLSTIIANEGGPNQQLQSLFRIDSEIGRLREVGASMAKQQFQVNNVYDMMVVRLRDGLKASWNANGGPAALDRIREGMMAHRRQGGHR